MKKTPEASCRFRLIVLWMILLITALTGCTKKSDQKTKSDNTAYKYVYQAKFAIILTETNTFLVRDNYEHTLFIGQIDTQDLSRFNKQEYLKPKAFNNSISIPPEYLLTILPGKTPYGQAAIYYNPDKWKLIDQGGKEEIYLIFDEIKD